MEFLKSKIGLDFSEDLAKEPELEQYLEEVVKNEGFKYEEPLEDSGAPTLNTDLSNFFIIAGLPKIPESKLGKLNARLLKVLGKRGVDFLTEEQIEMPMEGETTTGVAFVNARDSASARIAAAALQDYGLDKKHILATGSFDDFDRIVNTAESFRPPKASDPENLYSYAFEDHTD